jgi:hypothetical protein
VQVLKHFIFNKHNRIDTSAEALLHFLSKQNKDQSAEVLHFQQTKTQDKMRQDYMKMMN